MKRKLELEISEEERRYNRLLRYLTDYIYTVNIDNGKVVDTYHGPGCVAVTGYTSEDFQSDPELWFQMVHKEDRKFVLRQAENALAGKEDEPLIHRIIHRDGTIRWVKNSIVLSKSDDGMVHSYDGLINNVTDKVEAERITKINQEQLIQADKMVTLGVLASGMAHEINNPNNFILLNAQLFTKIWEDVKPILADYNHNNGDFYLSGLSYNNSIHKIDQSLSGIVDGSQRIKAIINSLTNFARRDTGQLDYDVDINKIVEKAIIIVQNLIRKSTDNFHISYGTGIPNIKGNPQQLEQVLINLITNACQSLDNRSKSVSVITDFDKDANKLIVKIIDEGIGIENDKIKYIIDPFFTTRREEGGTGLGLSITYNIVKNHKGMIKFESEPGKGTYCEISFPINS